MNWEERASRRIREVLPRQAERLIQRIGLLRLLPGSDSKFRRLATARERDAICDLFAEVNFTFIFIGTGFDVELEPRGDSGPDLRISRDGASAFVEVKRFRDTGASPRLSKPDSGVAEFLQPYGDLEKDAAKVRGELIHKLVQVRNAPGVVAFWSDSDSIEDLEFDSAMRGFRDDIALGVQHPLTDFLFAVFASDWLSIGSEQSIYCREICSLPPLFSRWTSDLEATSPAKAIQRAEALLRKASRRD